MKKKLLFLIAFLLLAVSFTACEDLLNCETCRYNTYVSGVKDPALTYGEAEYCGAELATLKALDDVVVGNNVTKFECN